MTKDNTNEQENEGTNDVMELRASVDKVGEIFEQYQHAAKKSDAERDGKIEKITQDLLVAEEARQKLEAKINRGDFLTDEQRDSEVEKETRAKFEGFLRSGDNGTVVGKGHEIEVRAMSSDSDPDGGYLVRPSFSNEISRRVFDSSPIRQVASVETIGSDELKMLVDDDEVTATWVNQRTASSDTDTAQVKELTIPVHNLDADPRVTQNQLNDSILDLEGWLRDKLSDKFGRTENTAFVSGDGVGKPKGILSYDNWSSPGAITTGTGTYEYGKVEQIGVASAGTLTASDFVQFQSTLKEDYQANATWLMRRATFGNIMAINSANNFHFIGFQPSDKAGNGTMTMTLLGQPVLFCSDMEANSSGNKAVAYGDFRRGYKVVDRAGITILRDPYSNKPYVSFYTTKRVGGAVTNFDAFKILTV